MLDMTFTIYMYVTHTILWNTSLKYFFFWYAVESPENNDSTPLNLLFSSCTMFSATSWFLFRSVSTPSLTLNISDVVELVIASTADWERVKHSLIPRIYLAACQCKGGSLIASKVQRKEQIFPEVLVNKNYFWLLNLPRKLQSQN